MIRRFAVGLVALVLLTSPAFAQDEQPPVEDELMVDPALGDDPTQAPTELSAAERQAAIAAARGPETSRATGAALRGLDKVTGQTQDFNLAAGQVAAFGRLELRLAECRYPAENPSSDAFAELTITDKRANSTVFSGWMIASSPALSAMDDSRYDVWVISCSNA